MSESASNAPRESPDAIVTMQVVDDAKTTESAQSEEPEVVDTAVVVQSEHDDTVEVAALTSFLTAPGHAARDDAQVGSDEANAPPHRLAVSERAAIAARNVATAARERAHEAADAARAASKEIAHTTRLMADKTAVAGAAVSRSFAGLVSRVRASSHSTTTTIPAATDANIVLPTFSYVEPLDRSTAPPDRGISRGAALTEGDIVEGGADVAAKASTSARSRAASAGRAALHRFTAIGSEISAKTAGLVQRTRDSEGAAAIAAAAATVSQGARHAVVRVSEGSRAAAARVAPVVQGAAARAAEQARAAAARARLLVRGVGTSGGDDVPAQEAQQSSGSEPDRPSADVDVSKAGEGADSAGVAATELQQ